MRFDRVERPGWRNWQTRQVEGLVRVNLVLVRIQSRAFLSALGRPEARFAGR